MFSTFNIAVWSCLILAVWRLSRVGRRPPGCPPGPPTVPVLGNLHLMPSKNAHEQLKTWADQYGPVYSLILGTTVMIVLSSDQAVKDLLDKRSAIYSDRPDMYIAQSICSGGLRLLLSRYGPTWRMIRRMAHQLLNINVSRTYVPYQDLESKQMLRDMLNEPDAFLDHFRRYASSLTTSMVFGWRTTAFDDPKMQQFFTGFDEFSALARSPAAALTDAFPVLRRLPSFLNPAKRQAERLHKAEKGLYRWHWLRTKEAVSTGTAQQCFCVDMAGLQLKEGFDDDQAAYISGSLLEAGSDTASSTLYGFVQAMLLYPRVLRKAQEELDRVIGPDCLRLPTMDDAPNMPYIRGCVKESLRWMPTTILGGAPHAALQDDEYMGYRIPKGAAVVLNVWAIHRDAERYRRPAEFEPERYKDDDLSVAESALSADVAKRDQFVFGAGRRLCQGIHVAERSLFLGISRLLWAFDIVPAVDASGNPQLPEQDILTTGLAVMPERFKASISPRSMKKAEFIKEEWKKEEGKLDMKTAQWRTMRAGRDS